MGVKGLTSFIDQNPNLLQDYHLHGCKVIFDGNNLYHFLYHTYNIRLQFNGDYLNYAKKIKQVFVNLKKCNIEPYVVFDGGYNTDDRKHQTVLQRARDRVRTSGKSSFRGFKNLLPVLAYETFKTVLDNLHIPHATCDYEADEHIAILSNKWNCPLISNDSDFYVYHIKAGFLPMDYVDFRIKQKYVKDIETGKRRVQLYILVQKYDHDNFSAVFGKFNRQFIPLMATVLGNDFVNGKVFSHFIKRFKRPVPKKPKISKRYSKTASLVSWLKKHGSLGEAIQNIMDHFPLESKPFIEKTIKNSILTYTFIESADTFLLEYLEKGAYFESMDRKDYYGNPVPEWLVSSLLRAEVPPFVQNAQVLRRVILQCQVEELRKPSSHEISKNIRRVLYGVLFSSQKDVSDDDVAVSRQSHIEEYDRKTRDVGKTYTSPITNITNFGQVLDVKGLPIVDIERKKDLILNVLCVSKEFVSQFNTSIQLLISVTVYWARSAGIPKYHLAAFLLNVILLRIIHYCTGKNKEPDDNLEKEKEFDDQESKTSSTKSPIYTSVSIDDFEEKAISALKAISLHDKNFTTGFPCDMNTVFQMVPISDLLLIKRNLTKEIVNLPSMTWKYEWPPRLSHCYSQFQSCLLYTLNLNQLLLSPFDDPVIPESYDGSTIFLLSKAMQASENMLVYAARMLGANMTLFNLFKSLLDVTCKEIGEDCFIETYTMKRRRKQEEKNQMASKSSYVQTLRHTERSDSETSEEEITEETISIDCEVGNRYSFL